ncbi:Clathrin light chain 1 [Hibiscus syriacus]|uniref:Clathrin light chain n=1 Tax=Hibiscus syriacus TaxID=106335 RepID=A0A6A3BH18_HIBSY|nr:Clathrin light chain 1 [Hibiscus syriacus]
MASFDVFGMEGEEIHAAPNNHHFEVDNESYSDYGAYSNFTGNDQQFPMDGGNVVVDDVSSSADIFGFGSSDPTPAYSQSPFGTAIPVENGNGTNGFGVRNSDVFTSDGPVLPPPTEMEPEEGLVLREWRRQNAIVLEEKEEKELRSQIIEEAEEYKQAFYKKGEKTIEINKTSNREREKVYLANPEKFHKTADKQYWTAIAELIPRDLKHAPPPHTLPPPPTKDSKDGKDAAPNGSVPAEQVAAAENGSAPEHATATKDQSAIEPEATSTA